jgi:enoyl-CoA hydratase
MNTPNPDINNEDGDITTEQRGHIWLIGLNRPAKYNGMTPHMFAMLTDAYEELERNPELRVGVLFGHGDHFTAGLDLPKFTSAMAKGGDLLSAQGRMDVFGLRAPWRTKPLITAVKGITFTAGIEMALAGDIIIAAKDARFSQLETKRSLMPTGGATFRFVERGGWGNAMRWLLTGDEFSAEEAYRIGLVQQLVEPGQELIKALEIAEAIAQRAPLAVQATLANARLYAQSGEAAAIAEFTPTQQRLSKTKDFAEGVQSFIERRAAKFTGE